MFDSRAAVGWSQSADTWRILEKRLFPVCLNAGIGTLDSGDVWSRNRAISHRQASIVPRVPPLDCNVNPASAGQRAAELIHIRTEGMAAPLCVRERHDAIHIGGQRLAFVTAGNHLGRVSGAVASRHYREIVARACAPILPLVPEKSRCILGSRRRQIASGKIRS